MKLKITACLCGLFILANLVGCTPHPVISPIEYSYNDFLQEQYRNTIVSGVYVGATITITLGSNPTTGSAWPEIAQISDSGILKQVDYEYLSPEQTGVLGASGKDVWTFKVMKEGTAIISMINNRPGENVAEEWAFKATIKVE
jgi:predicted secreted protein